MTEPEEWTLDKYRPYDKSLRLVILEILARDNKMIRSMCLLKSKDTSEIGKQKIPEKVMVILQGVWTQTHLTQGMIIHLINPLRYGNNFAITNQNGLLVTDPDDLLNCTLVASSLFCERKTWLNNVFLGPAGTNRAMLVGTLVHEVFQHSVKDKIVDRDKLIAFLDDLLDDATVMLEIYSVELTLDDIRNEAISYIPSVCEWVEKYMLCGPRQPLTNASDIEVKISEIRDIEECVWSTKYGLKGKIDVTGVVRVHDRKNKSVSEKIIPLELKTGNPNLSSSHAAQVSLYSMMIEDRYLETNQGFVIYLKNKAAMWNVTLNNSVRRDLIQRRNGLNSYLKDYFIGPDMLDQPRICANCERLSECILTSNIYDTGKLTHYSHMPVFEKKAVGHLSKQFIDFFEKYHNKLIGILAGSNTQSSNSSGKSIGVDVGSFWTRSSDEAERIGLGLAKLQALSTSDSKSVIFKRHPRFEGNFISDDTMKSNPNGDAHRQKVKRIKIDDYFKPRQQVTETNPSMKTMKKRLKPFDTQFNYSRYRFAISLDIDNGNLDCLNSSTAIAIGFINELKEDTFTMKIYEGSFDASHPELIYRVDRLEKKSNLNVERTVLVRLLEKENCDTIRQLIMEPDYKPKDNVDLNLHIISDHFDLISKLDAVHQKFVVGAASTTNYYILDEKVEPDRNKIDQLMLALIRLIRALDKSLLVVARNTDTLVNLMKLLQSKKLPFIMIDDGSSTKARYEFSGNLVKVPQSESLTLAKKFEIYIGQHEKASIVITTFAMSIGGLQFTRRRFDYCIAYECDKTELLLGLSPMFCSDKFIIVDIREDNDCIMIDEKGDEISCQEATLGQHLRSLRYSQ